MPRIDVRAVNRDTAYRGVDIPTLSCSRDLVARINMHFLQLFRELPDYEQVQFKQDKDLNK